MDRGEESRIWSLAEDYGTGKRQLITVCHIFLINKLYKDVFRS